MPDTSLGQELCALVLGMDWLYRSRPRPPGEATLAGEGLVPVDLWRGQPLPLAAWSAAIEAVDALRARLAEVSDPVRRAFLEDTLLSLETTARWQRGDPLPFRARASRLLGLDVAPVGDLPCLRSRVADGLAARGYVGSVGEAARCWEADRALPADRLERTARRLLAEARERTEAQLKPLPGRPLMGVALAHGVPWTGYCDYEAGLMRLNADQPFAPERLKLLVLHEGYPGHEYHLAWREADVRAGRLPADAALVITNTPSSPLFEGIGDNGGPFLDWLDADEHLGLALSTLRSAACVNACLMLHEDDRSPEETRAFLVEEGAAQRTWADVRVRFMLDPLRSPFVFSYYLGYRAVADAAAAWRGERSAFFACLLGQMHSPRSLRLAVAREDPGQ